MPWYFPWSDSIKKRACRYLLQHYVGQFLQEKLTLDQLSVDLFNGKGIVKDVPLDVWALNELLEGANVPLEILDGFIHTIAVSVPWSSLMQENCEVEVQGLDIVVAIKKNVDLAGSVTSESLPFSSMTTSLQLAQECLKDNEPNEEETTSQQPFDGLESFAQTIESVLSRIKVSFEDVLIRFEHLFPHRRSGVGLELHIKKINYSDLSSDVSSGDQSNFDVYDPPSLANKQLRVFGLKLSLDEFHESSRTLLRNTPYKPEQTSSPESVTSSPPLSPYQSAIFNQSLMSNHLTPATLLPAVVVLSSAGEQEANVKWKINPSCSAPKIELKYFLGTVNILLSPRQLHVLTELVEDINKLNNRDNALATNEGLINKPMKDDDFQRIEKELHEQMYNERKQRSKVDMWGAHFDDITDGPGSLESQRTFASEETFYSLTDNDLEFTAEPAVKTNVYPTYGQGLVQKVSEAGIVPLCGNAPNDDRQNSHQQLASKFSIPNPGLAAVSGLDEDNLTKGQLELSGLSITLLLQDPTPQNAESQTRENNASQDHILCKIADRFFDQMSSTAFGSKDLEIIQEKFNDACLQSHLRCFFTTVSITSEVTSASAYQCVAIEVSVGLSKLMECLVDNTDKEFVKHNVTQIMGLSGKEEKQSFFHRASMPCLKAKYKSVQRSCSPASIQRRHSVVPKTEIDVQFGDVDVEIDLTMIDRLHGVFHSSVSSEDQLKPSSQYFASAPLHTDANEQALFSKAMNDGSSCEQKIQIHVDCSSLTASLRFPILDLRPSDVRVTPPIWQKNLREELCLVRCNSVTFETCLQDSETAATYELRFKSLDGYWKFKSESENVHFIHVSQRHTENDEEANGFDLPRILISVQPVSGPILEEESSGDSSPDSLSDTCPMFKQEPSPFSSKPVMYDNEELVVPGDALEMKDFQEKTSMVSKLHIELNFPEIDANFQDPSFFELIYNRFGNDLLLWEPSLGSDAKKEEFNAVLASHWIDVDIAARLKDGENVQNNFQMCRSTINHDSYSSDEDDSDVSDQQKVLHTTEQKPTSTLAFSLNTSKLRIAMFPKTKIESHEDAFGKILLHFDNAQLFYVLDYKGRPNLCYINAQAQSCSLHHAVHVDNIDGNMDNTVFEPGDLYQTIYESDPGVKVTGSKTNMENVRAMLSLAVKSYWDIDKNAKDIVVALSLSGGTLRHRMMSEGQMWILQMIDYFGVTDEEVLGFVPPVVVTMLHVHFWDCALYYRPLHIPYQTLIAIEGFSISSNITLDSNTSILRFIIDNAVLLISNSKDETTNVVKDYISVADVDLFELSISTVTEDEKDSPKRTLTLSNNIVHVRTCSDSLSAVLDIVRYIVNDGDISRDTTVSSADVLNADEKKEIFNDSPVQQRGSEDGSLHDLMSDAMDESLDNKGDSVDGRNEVLQSDADLKTDVFDFPDESQSTSSQEQGSRPPCKEELDDASSDEDYEILDHPSKEPEYICEGPEVTSFCDEIKIIPDHFSVPVGDVDQLKAPSNYPTPLFVYTVKEMSILWQMFGGSDFQTNKHKTSKSSASHSRGEHGRTFHEDDDVDDDPVVIGNHGSKKRISSPKVNWKTNGGESRDLNTLVEVQLNKVRFQFEDYPDDTKESWRQVLLTQDVEIRDRLSSSQINKLLYQYSTEARPRQTHSNMISIKMLGLRPDDNLSSQEGCLRVSLKPLRLNIDQDTLQFIINFCKDLASAEDTNTHNDDPTLAMTSSSQNLAIDGNLDEPPSSTRSPSPSSNQETPIFFTLVEFSPDVPIRLDYHGKHDMDMGQGSLAGVLFAFAQLNCSEITLKRLCHRSGLMGFDRVLSYALNEWANDIKKRQIPGILGGVGPTYSFVQLVQGVKDLFWLPVEQYRRDGRIIRGLQRGASSFTTSSAMAFIELTNKCVQVIHGAAEVAYDIVSPTDNAASGSHGKLVKRRVNSEPADLRQGIANAYNVVTEGFGKTASNIVQVAKEEHENKGMTGAVGGVLRHIPSAVVQPIILATEATSNVLGGVRNQILPDARREAAEKWRVDE